MVADNLNKEIREIFQKFGISDTLITVYLAALSLGNAKASQIADFVDKDRVEVYHILGKLQQLGFVEQLFGKPALYSPISPIDIIERLVENDELRLKSIRVITSKMKDELTTLTSRNNSTNLLEKYLILKGRPRIYSFMNKQISISKKSVSMLMTPKGSIRRFNLGDIYNILSEKCQDGFTIKIIIGKNHSNEWIPLEEWGKIAQIRIISSQLIDATIYDSLSVSTSLANIDNLKESESSHIAIWTNSKPFVNCIQKIFDILWQQSS